MTSDASALTQVVDSTPEGDHRFGGLDHDVSGGISNPVLGMLLFITSEVMFFSGLFAAYFNVRANAHQWPPIDPATGSAFHVDMLPLVLPATILLIISSFTCQFGVWAIRRNDRTAFLRFFACEQDLSHEALDAPLPEAVAAGHETFLIVGAIAGG